MKTQWSDASSAPRGMRCIVGGRFLNPRIAIKDGEERWFDAETNEELSPDFWLNGIPPFPVQSR